LRERGSYKMPEQESFIERRKFERIDMRTKVEYRIKTIVPHVVEAKRPVEKRVAESVNISLGGLQIIDEQAPPPGQILILSFSPAGNDRLVRAFAKVKWVGFDGGINKYRIGLEFYYIHEEDRRLISGIVN
jgi:c-di-GMP-binding flagellar brake protein YcgR